MYRQSDSPQLGLKGSGHGNARAAVTADLDTGRGDATINVRVSQRPPHRLQSCNNKSATWESGGEGGKIRWLIMDGASPLVPAMCHLHLHHLDDNHLEDHCGNCSKLLTKDIIH